MDKNNLHKKIEELFGNTLNSANTLKEEALNIANSNMDSLENKEQKAFMKKSLDEAMSGKLDMNSFLNEIKQF